MAKERKNYRELGDCIVFYPDNYINDVEGEKLEDLCERFMERGYRKIVMDFSGTELINSIGVSVIIGIIEKIRDRKGIVLFSGLKGVNQEIFRIVGLTKHVQVFGSEEDALEKAAGLDARMLM